MIENYKGWDIDLNWHDKNVSGFDPFDGVPLIQSKKWVGVDLKGHKIYGASLKEIRHIIDYPKLHYKN